jgi:hypothetical protein
MYNIVTDVSVFLSSGIGIALQILALVAAIIPGFKWLSQKLDTRIDDNIDAKLEPFVSDICKQLSEVSNGMKNYQASTDTAIEYLDKAIANLQGIERDANIRRYIKDHAKADIE